MRVQFVWFNLNCTPKMNLGIALLVREMSEAGHEVSVLHLNEKTGLPFDTDLIAEQVLDFSPGLLALSFGRNHLKYAEQLIPELSRLRPRPAILCGGVHTTLFPDQVISIAGVDYVCIGEADGILVDFVERLAAGADVSDLPGFWGKEEGGRIWRTPMGPLPDISNQTRIDFEHIDHGACLEYNRGMFEVVTGRGCPNSCSFCFNLAMRQAYRKYSPEDRGPGPYCRKRSVSNLLGEMSEVFERFGDRLKLFSLADDAVNFDRQWMISFCREYAAHLDIPYTCNLLVSVIDDELAEALGESGAIAKIGVESGSERIRNEVLGKSFTNAEIEKAVGCLKSHDVPTRVYLMIGNPTETKEEILASMRFTARLRPTSTRLCIFYPVEGSPIHELCIEKSLLSGDEYENYDDLSVLKWDEDMALFIDKVHLLHAWMQNVYLGDSCAREYGPPLGHALSMPESQWSKRETRDWIRARSLELTRKLRGLGIAHYFNPFPERPDVTFLYSNRPVGLPNTDVPGEFEEP